MKNKALLLSAAIAGVLSLALPALAAGTGDQRGPVCTDIEEVQFALTEEVVGGVENPNQDPFNPDDDWLVEPTPTGKWDGSIIVRLPGAPCTSKTAYNVDLLLTGSSNGNPVSDPRKFSLTANSFTQQGAAEDPYWEWKHSFSIDTASQYEPTGACNKVESLWVKHVADSSPDVGTPGTDAAGRICGFETESGGARSYGARSFG